MFSFLNPSRTARIAPAEAIARHARGEITLIDVRDITELRATGRAKGAIHLPLMLLPQKADPRHPEHDRALSTDRPVVVYCASGARSARAAEILTSLGYREVYNLGGRGDWAAAGGAISRLSRGGGPAPRAGRCPPGSTAGPWPRCPRVQGPQPAQP